MSYAKFTRKWSLSPRVTSISAGIVCLAMTCLNVGGQSAEAPGSTGLLLTKDGLPTATIVISKEANKAAQFAAAELQHHIEKISGATLPIVTDGDEIEGVRILVGESAATRALGLHNADFKTQEYLIRFLPDTLILMGRDKEDKEAMDYADCKTFPNPADLLERKQYSDEQATGYAVYDFLEHYCGVRWYLPTDLGLVCPGNKTILVKGADVRRTATMKFRRIHAASLVPADLGDEKGPLLAERERALYLHRQRLTGVQPLAYGHAFYGLYYNSKYLKDHRDWFAKGYDQDMPEELRNTPVEKRPIDRGWREYPMKYYPNLCYTDEGLIEFVAEEAKSFFDTGKVRDPFSNAAGDSCAAGDYFSLEPMDSQDRYCKCPACEALLHKDPPCDTWRKYSVWIGTDIASDYTFSFVNNVARGVGTMYPGKYLMKLAYSRAWYPPTREPLEPNVAVMMVVFSQLRAIPALDKQVIEFLDKWDEATSAANNPKYLWMHCHRPGRVNPNFPGFMAHAMVKQMRDYHRRGYRGIFAEPAPMPSNEVKPGWGRRCLNANLLEMYLTFKLAYDETLDGDKLIDEFFTLFYGAAARPMQALYEAIERVYCDPANYLFDSRYFGYQTAEIAWGRLGTAEHMAEFGNLMEAAKNAAQTEMEKKRVALFEKNIWNRMQAGRREYENLAMQRAATQSKIAHAVWITGSAPDGDPNNVNWAQTPPSAIIDKFGTLDGVPTNRKLEAKLLHDGVFLYVQLQEMMDTSTLVIHADDNIWSEDDWEFFVGGERGQDIYRQIGINAKGSYQALVYGEKEKEWDSGARVVSDISKSDRWVVRMALPLKNLLPGGVTAGQTIHLNIFRGTNGDMKHALSWNPTFGGFHVPSQMGAVQLDKKTDY